MSEQKPENDYAKAAKEDEQTMAQVRATIASKAAPQAESARLTDREIWLIEHAQTISSPERLSVAQRRAIEHVIAERVVTGGESR